MLILASHAGDVHPKYNICFSPGVFQLGNLKKGRWRWTTANPLSENLFESLIVALRFIPVPVIFQKAGKSHWEKENERQTFLRDFKWKKGSNRAYERKKRQVNAGADDAERKAQIEERKAARSSHSKSQSHISHQDHLEAHETRKTKTMTNAYSLSTFIKLWYFEPPVPPLVFSMTQNAAKRCDNEKHVRLSPSRTLQVFHFVSVSLRYAHVCRVGICDSWNWC